MSYSTITAQEREQAFRRDLEELLASHGAEMDARRDFNSNLMIEVTLPSKFTESGEVTEEFAVFDL
jgi:hypothetical protein